MAGEYEVPYSRPQSVHSTQHVAMLHLCLLISLSAIIRFIQAKGIAKEI